MFVSLEKEGRIRRVMLMLSLLYNLQSKVLSYSENQKVYRVYPAYARLYKFLAVIFPRFRRRPYVNVKINGIYLSE